MSDEIKPAFSPEEWARFHNGGLVMSIPRHAHQWGEWFQVINSDGSIVRYYRKCNTCRTLQESLTLPCFRDHCPDCGAAEDTYHGADCPQRK